MTRELYFEVYNVETDEVVYESYSLSDVIQERRKRNKKEGPYTYDNRNKFKDISYESEEYEDG